MSKYVKDLLTREIQTRFSGVETAVWIDMTGVDAISSNQFRRELGGKQMRAECVKNALFRRACGSGPLGKLAEKLVGPAVIVSGGESPADIGKVIESWMKKAPTLKMRGGAIDGEYLDEKAISGLAKMPSKRDLQARVAGMIRSPGAKLAGAILSPGSKIAGCLKSLIEKLEKGAADAAPAA